MFNDESFYVNIQMLHPGVTGSCIYLEIHRGKDVERGLIDCGSFQEQQYSALNDILPFDAWKIDWVAVTHIHADHIGRIPYLFAKGYKNFVYMTQISKEILSPAMFDNMQVINNQRKNRGLGSLYDSTAVNTALNHTIGSKYGKNVDVASRTHLTFIQNGHLVGAAMILVRITCPGFNDINFLFTGDFNDHNMFFPVPRVKEWIRELPLNIITEATYGEMETSEIKPVFKDNIKTAISEGKSCLCLAFSLGRFQEVMHVIKEMQLSGDIPTSVPVYLDGKLAIKDVKFYEKLIEEKKLSVYKEFKKFRPASSIYVSDRSLRRSIIANDDVQKIVISTSGMGSYGPAQSYIPAVINRPNWLIHFTGYCTEGTLGYRLKTAPFNGAVTVGGMVVAKKADIEFTNEFTAHAKRDALLKNIQQFSNAQVVFINHGDSEVKQKFAEYLVENLNPYTQVGLLSTTRAFHVDSYGYALQVPGIFVYPETTNLTPTEI